MKDALIGWCHHTINFWLGCNQISPECEDCRAEGWMKRQRRQKFNVLRPTRKAWLDADLLNSSANARDTHELVLTCELSDFFHEQADPWRDEAWDVIRHSRNLIWLILTKRPERILGHLPPDWNDGKGFPHVWLGTTCGMAESFKRVDLLRGIPCPLRFLSCEPLLEDVSDIDLKGIGWILCGGMTGDLAKKNAMDLRWAAALYEKSQKAEVPFYFKQVSHEKAETGINALGLYLAYREGEEVVPETVACIRQYPKTGFEFPIPETKGVRWSREQWNREWRKLKS